jgi:S-DNA-T family DNA segregation ATPase FtsK/SpoIIIE
MPHLLVAGTTGSGKSVCINALIASMLFRFTPEELRLVIIDPKMVELQAYNSLPHLAFPIVVDPKKVMLALRWLIDEMERRYRIFARVGVRNIVGFNARPKKPAAVGTDRGTKMKFPRRRRGQRPRLQRMNCKFPTRCHMPSSSSTSWLI